MKRYSTIALAIASACAAFALSACGSDAGSGGTTTPTDIITGADAPSGADAAKDTATPLDTVAADVKKPCDGACKAPQTCDTKTDKCVDPLPCDNKCTATETCDKTTNKCVSACTPACKPGENCTKGGDGKFSCVAAACKYPDKWGPNLQKVSALAIADTTVGCDLNGDTKADNKLGKVVSLYKDANTKLAETVKDGTIVILLDAHTGFKTDNSAFDIDLLIGKFAKGSACDPTVATCDYTIDPISYNTSTAATGFCPALVSFEGAKDNAGKLMAGGDKQKFVLNVPVVGMNLNLTVSKASIQGDTTDATTWKSTKNGMLCGAITKTDLDAAIDAIPADTLAQIGDAATVKSLVAGVLGKPDVDVAGTGTADAYSVALTLETIPANVTGMYVAKP